MNIPFTEIQLKLYNILSCRGFELSESVGLSFGPCFQAKMGLVLLFFINAFARKWLGEEAGFEYSFFGGLFGGLVPYFIAVSILGSFKISFIIGLIGMGIVGFGGGSIFGGGEE
uniref:Uncharacterized protein n=1 Tax=viral metagenome TaxID=1070528 RepID=A0A6M3JHS8_9ZZZZ